MITSKDIRLAINQNLSKLNVPIMSRDVREGFDRPSFFVQLENTNRSGYVYEVHKALDVRIYYFPTDRYEYSIEVLEVQEQLEEMFDVKLRVKNRLFNIDETDAVLTDGVLNFSFSIEFYDARKNSIDMTIIYVDEDGYPTTEDEGEPVEVITDKNGVVLVDEEGKPLKVEVMEELIIDKE